MKFPSYKFERQKNTEGFPRVAGCDEVGVAPLAGPVVAATVILDPGSIGKQRSQRKWWYRVRDSKTVPEHERAELAHFIKEHCLDWGIGQVTHGTIDQINIHEASLLAMKRSVHALKVKPDFLLIDGRFMISGIAVPQQAMIDGDAKVLSISAASIIAKVARDKILYDYDKLYPQYGFMKHKGYPTKKHQAAILEFGPSPVHRRTFGFVEQYIKNIS